MSLLRKDPLFLHMALAGLIWVSAAEIGGVRFLLDSGVYLWEGEWSCRLFIFQIVREIFNILGCWVPAALQKTMVPDLADKAYFLGALFCFGALNGIILGFAGRVSGLLFSRIFRRRWHDAAWCPGFQLSVLVFSLIREAKGLYITNEILFSSAIGFAISFLISSALITLIFRTLLKNRAQGKGLSLACIIITAIFFIATPFGMYILSPSLRPPEGISLEGAKNPNSTEINHIILISVETLRYDHTSVGHHHRDTTPALARLAKEGVSFDACYSPASWTLPSMMSLVTGLWPVAHGVEDKSPALAEGVPTLAQIMKNYGYKTAAFYTSLYVSSVYGFDRGYEDYEEFNITSIIGNPVAEKVMDRMIPWLEENHARPFFLAVHIFDPHWSYNPPAPYDTLYDPDYAGPLTGHLKDFKPFLVGEKKLSPRDLEHFVALYDGEIRYTDAQLERLFDTLKSLGIYDDTLIIFTGDHGEEFMDHGGLSHEFTVFQEVIHVPLIIRFPERYSSPFPPGSRVKRPVTLIDIGPTILDALQLPPYESFEGVSLIDTDMTEDEWQARIIFSKTDRHYCHTICVIRDGMKYIHGYFPGDQYYPDKRFEGIFNLATDPEERNNIIDESDDLRKTMRGYIFSWIKNERRLNQIYASREDPVVLSEKIQKHLESLGYIK